MRGVRDGPALPARAALPREEVHVMTSMPPQSFLDSLRRGSEITFGASTLTTVQAEMGASLARALEAPMGATEEVRYGVELARPARDCTRPRPLSGLLRMPQRYSQQRQDRVDWCRLSLRNQNAPP